VTTRSPHPGLAKNLALIGGRGCGKSSISKRLARTNRNFMLFSLDALIRYECDAKSIPEIVADQGWRGFREREYEVVHRASAFEGGALLDCGGGVVVDLDDEGREVFSERKVAALRRHSLIVHLARDAGYMSTRIEHDPDRPLLSTSESFESIMARREPWYREAADHVIECGNRSKLELARDVLGWFYERLDVDPTQATRALR
jgi:shikimate kinase